ncbi:hypothetical protein SAMN04488564_101401 [Lentzea waywayandensis]|uniref:Uncharacterized protein n=1 Tax=Lentzea waywayandensis TaxID=84724 RepID=A0A1I6CVG9_9PSEU|nr:hypothetical protein [Lentzea waywayandensis]SFQ97160.1 hypothetical protein SAMN04488564_101401 [Lentzea waywayandensis]
MTEVHFDAFPAGDGVLARSSDENLTAMADRLDELLRLLEDGVVPPGRAKWWRTPAADVLLRRMFPVSDEFWAGHRESLTDPGPAKRVRARIDEPTPWLIGFDEVEDWLIAFGLMRALYLTGRAATTSGAQAFNHVPECLVVALQPSSATGWPAG